MASADDGTRQSTKETAEGDGSGHEEAFLGSTQLKAYAYAADPEMYRVSDGIGDCDGGTNYCTRLSIKMMSADTNLDKQAVDELDAALAEVQAHWDATMDAVAKRVAERKGIKEGLDVATAWYDDGIRLTLVRAHHGKDKGHDRGIGHKKGHHKH